MKELKALYVIVNGGHSSEIIDIVRECGATGATVLSARGSVANPKTILGITIDTEKDIILSVTEKDIAVKIMEAVKERAGAGTAAHGLSFIVPVELSTLNMDKSIDGE